MCVVYDATVDVLDVYFSAGTRITSREIAPGWLPMSIRKETSFPMKYWTPATAIPRKTWRR